MIRSLIAVLCLVLAVALAPLTARAADAKVENPAYKNWAKFKVGSWAELTSSMQMKGAGAPAMAMSGMKMTMKLVELTAEKAVVETSMTMNMAGQTQTMPGRRQDIPATVDASQVDETGMPQDPRMGGQKTDVKKGEEELTVMGKTLKCQWVEFTTKQGEMTIKGKAWISTEIPGGLVQSETHMEQMDGSMKLTGYEVGK